MAATLCPDISGEGLSPLIMLMSLEESNFSRSRICLRLSLEAGSKESSYGRDEVVSRAFIVIAEKKELSSGKFPK